MSIRILALGLLLVAGCVSAGRPRQPDVEFVDGVELRLEPAIVPDPTDGASRWWYTPSRKAHIYRPRYPKVPETLEQQPKQGEDLRLPGDLLPITYNVQLLPFIEVGNFTTDGYVEIDFTCVRSTLNITINSVQNTIDSSSITVRNIATNTLLNIVNFIDEQSSREVITVQVSTPLTVGQNYRIAIKFISILNAQLRGFYRSSYVENGQTKYLAVTQFEATDARRSFPCFDEPTMKATFSMTLGRRESWTSASNMPILRTIPIPGVTGYVWDIYETSVKMSSYLVAAMVSEFVGIPAEISPSGVEFRIWARADARDLTVYGRDIGPRILKYFEDLFAIKYPLPKQDMAAIPDFAAGAMENWGLITYREEFLLVDPATASATAIQFAAVVSAHELAHQWFGDLVTMDWWNAIWLNEGFASYMEYLGTDSVEPTFKMNEQFILENLQYVFGADALETSRPINIEVNTPAEINSLFDSISYEKGSCVIRMIADVLGFDVFKRGLTRYLNEKAYSNANQDDLWAALQAQANTESVSLPTTVKDIMDTWTYKMGYPLITVIRDYQTGEATVSQNRFLLRKSNDSTDTTVYQWWVPLTYTTDTSLPKSTQWLSKDEVSKTLTRLGASANQWLIFNVDQQNYYRVTYDTVNYGLIRDQLVADHLKISDNNRAQLLDDSFVLASVNLVPYAQALDLTLYLRNEREYVPWDAVTDELIYIDGMLFKTSQYADWKRYLAAQVTPFFNYVGFQESPTDAHLTIFSRTDAMYWACRLQVAACVQGAQTQYAALMQQPNNNNIISINQRSIVLRTAIENGGQTEFDFSFNRYLSTKDTAYLIACAGSRDPATLNSLLQKILDPNSGVASSVNTLFNYVANNPVGNDIALDFLINQWNQIQSAVGVVYFQSWFRYVCTLQNTPEGLSKLIKLRDDHFAILGNSNTVQQGLDVVTRNIDWMTLHQVEIGTWLAVHY